MKQQIKALLDEERGVSPVIGVILMVAITVILAAVIGTFVLGLGDSLEQAPQATLGADVNSSNETIISHNGGDGLATADIRIVVGGSTSVDGTTATLSGDADGELNVGDTLTIDHSTAGTPSGDTQVRVIHTPSESILLDTEVTY